MKLYTTLCAKTAVIAGDDPIPMCAKTANIVGDNPLPLLCIKKLSQRGARTFVAS